MAGKRLRNILELAKYSGVRKEELEQLWRAYEGGDIDRLQGAEAVGDYLFLTL